MPSKDDAKKRKEEEREHGVFYDDEYDYLQHMKSRDEIEYDWDEVDKITKESKSENKSSNIKLPGVVFPSKEPEEEIGLLNRAAPHKGPLLDWDPDIVETLDDEFKHETVYNLKDIDIDAEDQDEDNDLDMILAEAKLEGEEVYDR